MSHALDQHHFRVAERAHGEFALAGDGRALQHAAQQAWSGKPANVAAAERAFAHRARMNSLASRAQWTPGLETAA